LDAGSELTAAYVAPGQNWVLAATADGPAFFRLAGGAVSRISVAGVTASPERVAFSPSGTAVAVYAAGRIQVVQGLPDAPRVAGALSVGVSGRSSQASAAARSRRGLGSFAVSDDGLYVLYADDQSIRLWGAGGENFTVMQADSSAVVAFAPGGHSAAAADPAGGVALLGDVAGAGARRSLAAPGMAYPVGLAFSADGWKLFLADAAARQVTAYDLAAGAQTVLSCDCVPAGLFPMGGLFRLNEAGAAPLWLLDARSADARIVFVPARSE